MNLCKRESPISNLAQQTPHDQGIACYQVLCMSVLKDWLSAVRLCIGRPELTFHPCNSCVSSVVSAGDTLETSGAAGPSTFSAPGHPCIAENHKQSYSPCRKPWPGVRFVQQYQLMLSV